jgi:hypothetical protein
MEQAAIAVLKTRPKSLKDFTNGMQKRGVTVTEAKN